MIRHLTKHMTLQGAETAYFGTFYLKLYITLNMTQHMSPAYVIVNFANHLAEFRFD